MAPTTTSGRICNIEMPATLVLRSAELHKQALGWTISQRRDGRIELADTIGEVNGASLYGRKPAPGSGALVYVMIDDMTVALDAILTVGERVVQPIAEDKIEARFRDAAEKAVSFCQEPA